MDEEYEQLDLFSSVEDSTESSVKQPKEQSLFNKKETNRKGRYRPIVKNATTNSTQSTPKFNIPKETYEQLEFNFPNPKIYGIGKQKYYGISNAIEDVATDSEDILKKSNTKWGKAAVGAVLAAGALSSIYGALSSNKGQMSNAQLYGQQPLN